MPVQTFRRRQRTHFELDQRISIQSNTPTGFSREDVWADVAEADANIRTLSGGEATAVQAIQSETTHEVTMLWQPGITEKMRVKWVRTIDSAADETRYFDILAIREEPNNMRGYLIFLCREGQSKGS